MSALPAPRRVAREGRPREEGSPRGRRVLGPSRTGLRRPGRHGSRPRSRPRGARGQPHRPLLHRRPLRRLPLRLSPPRRLLQHACLAARGRWPAPPGTLDLRRRTLRPAKEQTHTHRTRPMPPLHCPRARTASYKGHRLPRRLRLGLRSTPPRRPSEAQVLPRLRARDPLRADPPRLLSPLPTEHLYRRPYRTHARRSAPSGARTDGQGLKHYFG